jgi:hypothetical protein
MVEAVLTFTLDTNCIIDVEENRPAAPAILQLASAHSRGLANVSLVAMSASERQPGSGYLTDFGLFQDKVRLAGLGHLGVILPMLYWDVSFWDKALWSDAQMGELERKIHVVLFPNIEFDYEQFCEARGLEPKGFLGKRMKWRNAKCDVQAIWSHIYAGRDVFVTNDENYHKNLHKPALIALGAGHVEYPDAAAGLLPISRSSGEHYL